MAPPVTQVVVVYVVGLWAAFHLKIPPAWAIAPAGIALLLLRTSGWANIWAVTAIAGICSGSVAGRIEETSCHRMWKPGRVAAVVQLLDTPGARGMTTGSVLFAHPGCGGEVKLRFRELNAEAEAGAGAGAVLVVVGQYRFGGLLTVGHARNLRGHSIPAVTKIRQAVSLRIRHLYGPRAPLVEALVLGRREGIDPGLRQAFAGAGLAHLLAISGLHVGFLAAWLVVGFGWLLGRSRGETTAIMATWGYVLVLGFPAPATRAATFLTVALIARRRQRNPPLSAVVALAGALILTVDPASVASVGTWLSVAAVLGARWAGDWMGWARRHPVLGLLSVSFGATVWTAPFTALFFGTVAPIGLLANLPAVPLASLAVPAVFASLLAGAIPAGAAGLGLAAIERIAVFSSALPGGQVSGESGWAFAAPWAGLLIFLVWYSRTKPKLSVLGLRAAWVAVAVIWGSVAAVRPIASSDGQLSVFVLSVGQGDAIAVRTPGGHWVLVDAGPRMGSFDAGREVVVPFLRRHGVRTLDAVVVSHGDQDHLGGVPSVLENFPTRMVIEPAQPLPTDLYQHFLGTVELNAETWWAARASDTLKVDGVTFAVMHPSASWVRSNVQPNENSVVLHLKYGEFDMILTGDAGFPVEDLLLDQVEPVEVLKVGHHGSAGSTGERWVEALDPQVAVVSVGKNSYGHPSPVVLNRLQSAQVRLFRTDRDATVTIRTDGRYFAVFSTTSEPWTEALTCTIRAWSRFRDSSWSRNACTTRQPANSQTFSTTSP